MSKVRTINLEPNDSTIRTRDGGFTWEFSDTSRNLTFRMKFPRWWVGYLADDLWAVVVRERQEVERQADSLKADPRETT